MAFADVLASLKSFFAAAPCKACIARDYHIANLKEIIHQRDEFILQLETSLARHDEENLELIKLYTGRSKPQANENKNPAEWHSMPRKVGIQSRIQLAERKEREEAAPLTEQRKKEYNERIDKLLGNDKETEIVEEKS